MCWGGGREMGKDKEKDKHIRIMATSKVQSVIQFSLCTMELMLLLIRVVQRSQVMLLLSCKSQSWN